MVVWSEIVSGLTFITFFIFSRIVFRVMSALTIALNHDFKHEEKITREFT